MRTVWPWIAWARRRRASHVALAAAALEQLREQRRARQRIIRAANGGCRWERIAQGQRPCE